MEFFTPSIVHVVKGQPTKTLVVTAKPEQVAITQKSNIWASSELTVKQDAQGNLTFLTAKGKVLLREKSCDVKAVRQTFLLDKGEAIYGLGTFQNGKMNRRGEHKRMEQTNLEDFMNVLQSIKGWGLYWENYSPTQFDDDANGMSFTSEAGDGIDYYFMYGGSADGVIAQMRHFLATCPCSRYGPMAIGNRKSVIRLRLKQRASLTNIANCKCLWMVSSKTGNTGATTICGTPWTSFQKTL